jgi:threonine dehydrogenase-like Zn-dependent dehydrogenase
MKCYWIGSYGIRYRLLEAIPDLQKGDILGHEFCGIISSVGPAVKRVKVGDRAVASFQIACGQCYYCKKKLTSMCERTNSNEEAIKLYGRRTAGMSSILTSVGLLY